MTEFDPTAPVQQLLARLNLPICSRQPPALLALPHLDEVSIGDRQDIASSTADALQRCSALVVDEAFDDMAMARLLWPFEVACENQKAFVLRHRDVLALRAKESEALMSVIGLVSPRSVATWQSSYAPLKAHLIEQGLRPAGWKLLAHFGSSVWEGIRATDRMSYGPIPVVVALANAVAAIGYDELPPPDLIRVFVHADAYVPSGEDSRLFPARMLRAAWDEYNKVRCGERGDVLVALAGVIDWFHRAGLRSADIPARVQWAWFTTNAQYWWDEHVIRCETAMAAWPHPIAGRRVGPYQIVPLTTPLSAWEESRLMRHCLSDREGLGSRLDNRSLLAFSIREPARKRPVATFTARRLIVDKRERGERVELWALEEIKGFANRAVETDVRQLGLDFLYGAQPAIWLTHPHSRFEIGQLVWLARPDHQHNRGWVGEIAEVGPVIGECEAECGDCMVRWHGDTTRPQDFDQLIPIRHAHEEPSYED